MSAVPVCSHGEPFPRLISNRLFLCWASVPVSPHPHRARVHQKHNQTQTTRAPHGGHLACARPEELKEAKPGAGPHFPWLHLALLAGYVASNLIGNLTSIVSCIFVGVKSLAFSLAGEGFDFRARGIKYFIIYPQMMHVACFSHVSPNSYLPLSAAPAIHH